jgi:tRNA-splicing ligase RtcB
MKQIITSEKRVIKLWLDDIDDGALDQAKNMANLPSVFKHIAIMPDAHKGYGMPIGGVLALKDAIIPNAVGYDINCGLIAQKTSLQEIDRELLKKVLGEIRKLVPVGNGPGGKHKDKQVFDLMPSPDDEYGGTLGEVTNEQFDNARHQLGTLGGGNHFIEIQQDTDGYIWIMIHSGSRNMGYKVAQHYNKLARELNERWKTAVPKEWGLAFLPLGTEEAHAYIEEMNYCIKFALANRKLMMARCLNMFLNYTKCHVEDGQINVPHNYATMENHFGSNIMVHRKGATRAREGELGIIPGSQGTASYIVVGKGNVQSFKSCSHGAGRVMGRKEAQKKLNLEKERNRMEKRGILHSLRHDNDLDEAPSAYKNIHEVMKNQEDLVDIKVRLKPLAVVKG